MVIAEESYRGSRNAKAAENNESEEEDIGSGGNTDHDEWLISFLTVF